MTTNATYKSFSNAVIQAEVGLHVGLYGINVTLRGESLLLPVCWTLYWLNQLKSLLSVVPYTLGLFSVRNFCASCE